MDVKKLLGSKAQAETYKVDVPELPEAGGHLYIRRLSMADSERAEKHKTPGLMLMALSLAHEDGRPLFDNEDDLSAGVEWIRSLPASVVRRIDRAATSFNDLDDVDEDDAKKNASPR